jgi:hypothetical protein
MSRCLLIAGILVAGLLPALLAGCRSAAIAAENDRLRSRVVELEDELTDARGSLAELRAELATLAAAAGDLPEDIRANTPHVVTISIGRLSHARDDDGDGRADRLIIYVNPADGRDRFVQCVGELTAHAALLPAQGEAATIARVTLAPAELRDAYRSGVTGTHYTIELPIALPADIGPIAACDVRVGYVDGRTGRRCEAHRSVSLEPVS